MTGTKRRAECSQDVRRVLEDAFECLKSGQGDVQQGLTQVEVERQGSASPQISCGNKGITTASTRTLSNYFNFQWTKVLYQNNLKHIAFFPTFFKGYRCNKSSVVAPKKFLLGA